MAFSDNEFANTTTDELQEQYYGNFGIQWRDHEHVAQVKERQEQATAYIAAFWELTDIAIAYPPFIGMLGEALHEVGEAVRVVYPGPDMDRIRAEVRAAIQGGELPPGAFADAIEPDPEDGDARVAALLQSIRPRGVLLAPPYLQEDMHDLFAHEARLHDEAAEAARDPAPAPAAA